MSKGLKHRVLLADDSATILMMQKMLLSREPIELITASDGREAFEKACSERPDLVVLDVVMPHLTGFEVCRRLRQTEGFQETPILLVTTRGEPENVENGYASGCTDYITKPIDSAEFLAKVREYLPK